MITAEDARRLAANNRESYLDAAKQDIMDALVKAAERGYTSVSIPLQDLTKIQYELYPYLTGLGYRVSTVKGKPPVITLKW